MTNPAHLLSLSRALLAPGAAWALWRDAAAMSFAIFAWVVVSDVLDGRVARRRGDASEFGTLLDHGADCVFVTLVIATAAVLGLLPVALPVLIVAAFARYALAARAAGGGFRGSQLGRVNGIAYFVLVFAVLIVRHFAPAPWAAALLQGAGWVLALSTLLLLVRRPPGGALQPWPTRRS
ncbi:MAG: CDP-alcohol phosphatidyltransferase family protein [Gammaproteobacteria bacterium]|nr:CDP-alcohol phosphatidyltransferase family protein [Gammaproteobacteria bacterium]